MTIAAVSQRKFVPQDLDVADFEQLQPLFQSLLDRDIASPADLEQWLADVSELSAVVYEYGNRRYIDKSCHTDDPEIEKAFLHFVEQVEPKIKPYSFEISKRFLSSPHRTALTDHRYEMLARQWRPHVELFREENIPLETELTRLNNEYDKLFGAMMVHFRGKEYTIQQLARFFEEPDRSTRQEAWELRTRRYLQDGEAIYEKMLPIRQTIAENAGLADYREYTWKDLKRFDYTPEDCLRFADAIAEVCVPIVQELDRKRAADLGLEQLRPWDLSVDPKNRPPLRPFDESDVESFVARTQEIFGRLSPELAGQFATLRTARSTWPAAKANSRAAISARWRNRDSRLSS
jgi:oligoendopeptidase F